MTSVFDRPTADMSEAAQVMATLDQIQQDLALRQNLLEQAARNWYLAKREKEHKRAVAFLTAEGSVASRTAEADVQTALDGREAEAEYESLKAVVRVMETRATICQSLLKAQAHA
jgi:hypothetical protein